MFVNRNRPCPYHFSLYTCGLAQKKLLFKVKNKNNFIAIACQLTLPSTIGWRCSKCTYLPQLKQGFIAILKLWRSKFLAEGPCKLTSSRSGTEAILPTKPSQSFVVKVKRDGDHLLVLGGIVIGEILLGLVNPCQRIVAIRKAGKI